MKEEARTEVFFGSMASPPGVATITVRLRPRGDTDDRLLTCAAQPAELLWVIDPELEMVTVYRRGAPTEILRPPAALDGAPVLSEFSLPLADLFAAKDVD
jgi:hypothetical protein